MTFEAARDTGPHTISLYSTPNDPREVLPLLNQQRGEEAEAQISSDMLLRHADGPRLCLLVGLDRK